VNNGETKCSSIAGESPDADNLRPRLENGIGGIWELLIGDSDLAHFTSLD
jgi:hypothetical protein